MSENEVKYEKKARTIVVPNYLWAAAQLSTARATIDNGGTKVSISDFVSQAIASQVDPQDLARARDAATPTTANAVDDGDPV